MASRLYVGFLVALLFLCIHCTKHYIQHEDDQPNKKQSIASEDARRFLNTPNLDDEKFIDYFMRCPLENRVGDFVFFLNSPNLPISIVGLCQNVIEAGATVYFFDELEQYEVTCWVDMLVAAKNWYMDRIFAHLVPKVVKYGMQVDAFRGLFRGSFDIRRHLRAVINMASIIRSGHSYYPLSGYYINNSFFPNKALLVLLTRLREKEVEYFLRYVCQDNILEILKPIIEMIVNQYSKEDEYSIIAKMTLIEIAKKLERERNENRFPINEADIAEYSSLSVTYLDSLTKDNDIEFLHKVMKTAFTSSKTLLPFPTTFKAIINISSELRNYGAVEYVRYLVIDLSSSAEEDLDNINYSTVDPSYDNYRIFELALKHTLEWRHFYDDIFSYVNWQTEDCIKSLYRMVKSHIPEIAAKLKGGFERRRIGGFSQTNRRFVFPRRIRIMNTDEVDNRVTNLCGAIKYIFRFEGESHKYTPLLLKDLAAHIPDLFPYLHRYLENPLPYDRKELQYYLISYMFTNGAEFMETADEMASLDAAIYAAKIAKSHVASYLLKIYDKLDPVNSDDEESEDEDEDIDFEVSFDTVDANGQFKRDFLNFYGTILTHLYDDTEYKNYELYPGNKLGKERLLKIFSEYHFIIEPTKLILEKP